MRRILLILAAAVAIAPPTLEAQHNPDSRAGRFFVGSSAFVAANLVLAGRPDAPDFYQLNAGYWLTDRDAVSVEAITWRYIAPVGIPYGPSFGSAEESYPGYVRESGIGMAYQRLLRGNFYSAVHVLPLVKQYFDEEDEKIQNGFRLFLTGRAGYHLALFSGCVVLEPSIAATYWPIDTKMPAAFEEKERNWPKYFLFEPGLHFAVRF
jgi:hypothetical protein